MSTRKILIGHLPYGSTRVLLDHASGRVVETLGEGCFADAAARAESVVCRLSHNDAFVYGTAGKSGAARLWEKPGRGLYFAVVLGDDRLAAITEEHLAAGRYLGVSFEGPALVAESQERLPDGRPLVTRTITRVIRLVDVSPTEEPAYESGRCWLE